MPPDGSFGHIALHATAGCAAAELQGASCGVGAAAGAVQAIYAGSLGNLTDEERNAASENALLIGATVGFIFSGGDPENVSTASLIAQSGIINN